MSFETPDDPLLRALRARLFQRIVHKIVIDDDGDGPIIMTLFGHLVPADSAVPRFIDPTLACGELIEAWEDIKSGRTPKPDADYARLPGMLQTDLSPSNDKSVWSMYSELQMMPSVRTQAAMRRACLTDVSWSHQSWRTTRAGVTSMPAWTLAVQIEIAPNHGSDWTLVISS